MFAASPRLNYLLSALFIVALGSCGNLSGCGGCSSQPLPAGGLPPGQTIEGGAQVRVTPAGFNKLTSILPGIINQSLGSGFCVPEGSVGSPSFTGANYCSANDGGGCNPGCKVNASLNSLTTQVTNNQTLDLTLSTSISTTIHIDGAIVFVPFSCDLGVSSNNLNGDLDIAFGIDQTTGELTINLDQINSFHLGLDFSGCSFVSSIANFAGDVLDSFIGQFIVQLLTPTVNNLIQGFLPHPLGLEGMTDVGALLSGISPGAQGELETRLVPGGYVSLNNNGMSLGLITGFNSDQDPTTRTPDLISEPALCVPPIPVEDFGAAPDSLPITSRSTFALNPADQFDGMPDPAADLAMGISKTTLNLAGHHLVTSGGMCLGIGTSFIKQLNVGTIGILVPSLSDLQSDQGNDPLLLVTRPQRALTFTIGDNTTASPALTIGVSHMEIDFYAFLFERYVRAFTLDLSMNVGVNLEFEQMGGMPAVIKPTLLGISSQTVTLSVINSEFVKETPQHLEMVLPTVFDLLGPLLGNIPDITVPSFAGFSLNNLSIQHVMTSQDDFLALFASLGASTSMRVAAAHDPWMNSAIANMDLENITYAPPASPATPTLVSVVTPSPEKIRNALTHDADGAMPAITFDVPKTDAEGRALEWSWNLNGGMFRGYSSASPLVIRDGALAWQGKYTVGLKSRVKGDYRTVSPTTTFPVTIDSEGPHVLVGKADLGGDSLTWPLWDVVSGEAVQYGFGKPAATAPDSWTAGSVATLPRGNLANYAVDNQLAVWAKDELGNTTKILVATVVGEPEAGSGCNAGGGATGGLVLLAIGGVLLIGRRRINVRRTATVAVLWLGGSVAMSLQPGCSCHSKPADMACDTAADCGSDFCPAGQLAFCVDNTCVCSDDVPVGRLGPYSHVATAPDGSIWVSAYAQTYGDLVVAKATGPGRIADTDWEWVDGVPSGPVVVPGSMIRGGITDNGPDVGMYTSIAVAQDGTPMVTYFDRDGGSLKFAARVNGAWQTHVVDQGTGTMLMPTSGTIAGMYSSITLRSDNGNPGVAYLAHTADAMGEHAEVRYVSAQVPVPTSAADWQSWVVDTAAVPVADPNNPDPFPLPEGLGLFITSARLSNQSPVVAYYDRVAGELKLAKFDVPSGQFATPVVIDGDLTNGVDAGWSPTLAVDGMDVVHIAYVNATRNALHYTTDAASATNEIIDDGYRIVGTSVDGLPKPTFDFVGANAGLVLGPSAQPMVAYQDATTQELLLATRAADGTWSHVSIAGAVSPWPGAYGFYASDVISQSQIVMSSWVIDQPTDDNWVEVFARPVIIQ